MNFEKADQLWNDLSDEEKDYLLAKHALTTLETKTALDISRARLSQILARGQLRYVKADASATIFSSHEIAKRKIEAQPFRDRRK